MTTFSSDKRLIIGCDLDDVLADFIKKFMEIAAKKYGVDATIRPTSWEWDGADMTPERVDGVWSEILSTTNFWETLDIEPGADFCQVHRLNEATRIYFPTARAICPGRGVEVQSARWLHDQFDLSPSTVIVSNEKGPLAAALKYDYFIDDRPKNCIDIKYASPKTKVFLKNASHNQGVRISEVPRIENFNEFVNVVLGG